MIYCNWFGSLWVCLFAKVAICGFEGVEGVRVGFVGLKEMEVSDLWV